MKFRTYILGITSIIWTGYLTGYAQGDGPRSNLLAPVGVWGLNPKYLNLDQNLAPAGNILVEGARFKIDVFPITLFHTFGIGNRYARVLAMVNPGSGSAKIDPENNLPGFPSEVVPEINFSGFSDGFVAFEIGLLNANALTLEEFSQNKPEVSLLGQLRLWYSGSYDSEKLANLGTNRFAIEVRSSLLIPLHKELSDKATWIELVPKIQMFTDNNDPARSSRANKTEQKPLFWLESHLSHNFSKKLWGSVDLGYQVGGETIVDGNKDGNQINYLGGGLSLGYQFLPYLSAYTSYGQNLFSNSNAETTMLRLNLVFTYMNLNK
ncbi:transporter [Eudoraea chungangensis]|uniref:transporter n=1 Tax=Eudoraea chungangensis TaxID=1481905 RepID=UPI0023ED082E|nr:transporter [Eudoraea chungangensis]